MRCLSVRQPFASLIAAGIKDIENRSWEPMAQGRPYRGPILIHAGMTWGLEPGDRRLPDLPAVYSRENLPRGCIVGQAELVDVVRDHPGPWAEEGQWHWVLRDAAAFDPPVPYPGRQGLFHAPEPTDEQLFKPHDGRTRAVNMHHEPADLAITRPSMWGNPFRVVGSKTGWRVKPDPEPDARYAAKPEAIARSLALYEAHVQSSPEMMAALPGLRDKRLGCFCAPLPCHGDVLARLVEGMEE